MVEKSLPLVQVRRATTVPLSIRIKKNQVPEHLTDYVLWFTVRKEIPATSVKSDIDALITKKNAVSGDIEVWSFKLTAVETNLDPGRYVYDVRVRTPEGDTVAAKAGIFEITGDVGRGFF